MAYKQKNNPFKNILSDITSKFSVKTPDIKQQLDKKYGLGKFAGLPTEKRRKPGESEYNYRTRMQNLERRRRRFDKSETTSTIETAPEEETVIEVKKDDLTDKSQVVNYGITPDMSFNEAFAQVGKQGATTGDIFEFQGEKILYEFKDDKKIDKNKDIKVDKKIEEKKETENIDETIVISNKITDLQDQIDNEKSVIKRGKLIAERNKLQKELDVIKK